MPAGIHSELNPNNPPSNHAMGVLMRVEQRSFPAQEVNQTVSRKLLQFGYITTEERPSPYKTHPPGTLVNYMVITQKGRIALHSHKMNRRASRLLKGGLV